MVLSTKTSIFENPGILINSPSTTIYSRATLPVFRNQESLKNDILAICGIREHTYRYNGWTYIPVVLPAKPKYR